MIIGNGLLATAFSDFEDDPNVVVFASGVSDSLCNEDDKFQRERDLLENTVEKYPNAKLVYFSTCSIEDIDRANTAYVQHKLEIESYIQQSCASYLILRLSAVIGKTNVAQTFPFKLAGYIDKSEVFDVWLHAIRYPIDVDDVSSISRIFIHSKEFENTTQSIASYPYKVPEIVSIMERLKGKVGMKRKVSKGVPCYLKLDTCYRAAESLGIRFDFFYLEKVLQKYNNLEFDGHRSASHVPSILGGHRIRGEKAPILFGAPVINDDDVESVTQCLKSRWIGKGKKCRDFELEFARFKGATDAVAVSSCTDALHLSLMALGIERDDEVIIPTMTFCATAQAVEMIGATPVLADCDPRTLNMTAQHIEQRITQQTKAIIVVHLAGRCAEMSAIMALAQKHALVVIEDCAHALESVYQDTPAGMMGDAGCFSFYATKSITTGDGGMVVMKDPTKLQSLRLLANHGMTSDAWARVSSVNASYEVVSRGFKSNMTDLEASLGLSQFKKVMSKWKKRKFIWEYYREHLSNLPILLPPKTKPDEVHGYHLFSIVLTDRISIDADAFITALKYEGIGAGVHYHPLHCHPYYAKKLPPNDRFPTASKMYGRLLSLPLNSDLELNDLKNICQVVCTIAKYFEVEPASNSYQTEVD